MHNSEIEKCESEKELLLSKPKINRPNNITLNCTMLSTDQQQPLEFEGGHNISKLLNITLDESPEDSDLRFAAYHFEPSKLEPVEAIPFAGLVIEPIEYKFEIENFPELSF